MTEEDFVRFALSGPSHRILRGRIDHLSSAGPSPYTSPGVDTPPPVISTGQEITHCRCIFSERRWLSINQAVFVDRGLVRRPVSIKHAPFVDRSLVWRWLSMNQAVFVDWALVRRWLSIN